jgi:biotin-(acetyl-CoA carboxylase) ligase
MATKIDCLRLLSSEQLSHFVLANRLNITSLKLLELIGQINKIEPSLINNQSGDKLYLTRSIDWLELEQITHSLERRSSLNDYPQEVHQSNVRDYTIQILNEIDSTNDYIFKNLEKLKNKTVVTAEYQSLGKARNGKVWITSFATDITASFVNQFELDFKYELLPIIISVAVNRLFKQFGVSSKIKWPNDVMLPDKTKIAGILVECCIRDSKRYVVIGVGVDNVGIWGRNALFASLIQNIANIISEYEFFGFDLIYREWLDNCIHYKRQIKLYQDNNLLVEGAHMGLSKNGSLIIETTGGEHKEYQGGNLSLIFE